MRKVLKIDGELEIDANRGVIYFHLNPSEATALKIQTLLRVQNVEGLTTDLNKLKMIDLRMQDSPPDDAT